MTLWSDPIRWSESVAKTKLHLLAYVLIQAICILYGLYQIHLDNSISTGKHIILFAGIIMPSYYLYAMYRLLKFLRENAEQAS